MQQWKLQESQREKEEARKVDMADAKELDKWEKSHQTAKKVDEPKSLVNQRSRLNGKRIITTRAKKSTRVVTPKGARTPKGAPT